MNHPRLLAIACLCAAAACAGERNHALDSAAVTTTAANGALLGDTALSPAGRTPATTTAITPARPAGRPVPAAVTPAAPNAKAAAAATQPATGAGAGTGGT